MKRIALPKIILAACLCATAAAYAAPTQLSANAGEVRDIKYASGSGATAVMYAATQGGGVFKSADAGQTWAPAGNLNTGYAWKIAVSPLNTSRVYVATDSGVWRSTDAGATWAQVTYDPARAVAIDPGSVTNDTVLAGVPGNGILRSTDNGTTWTRQSSGLNSTNVTQIAFQSSGVAYAVLDCNLEDTAYPYGEGAWGGIFKSSNGGMSWSDFNTASLPADSPSSPTSRCIKALAVNSSTVFVGTYDPFGAAGQVYFSTGGSFALAKDIFGVESLATDRNASTTLYAGSRSLGVFASATPTVSGSLQDYINPATDPDVYTRINAIETVPGLSNTVVVGAKGLGIMRTPNYTSTSWSPATGIAADRVRGLANHANVAASTYWLGLQDGGVMKSTTAGASWSSFDLGFDFGYGVSNIADPALVNVQGIAADPSNTSLVIVATRSYGLLALNSGGTAWDYTLLPSSLQNRPGATGAVDFQPQSLIIPSTNQIYYALFEPPSTGKGGGLLASTSGVGGFAQTVYPDYTTGCRTPPDTAYTGARKVVATANSVMYLLRYDDLPYRSTNNFATNTAGCINASSTGFERLAFNDITQNPSNNSVVVGATNKGIYRSGDGGANWARVAVSGLATQVLSSVAYIPSGILYGVSRGGGFYCSTDDGTTWQAASLGGLPAVSFRELKYMNGSLHILTDGGGVYNGFAGTCP